MPTTITAERMRTQIEALFRAYNKHDVDAILALCTDDVVWEDPNLPEPAVGKDAAGDVIRNEFVALPDMHFPKEEIVIYTASGGRAASRFHLVGTMTGRMDPPGYQPTGRTADTVGMCSYEFRDGLISRHAVVFDLLGFTQALGLMPSTESLAVKTMVGVQNVGSRLARVIHR